MRLFISAVFVWFALCLTAFVKSQSVNIGPIVDSIFNVPGRINYFQEGPPLLFYSRMTELYAFIDYSQSAGNSPIKIVEFSHPSNLYAMVKKYGVIYHLDIKWISISPKEILLEIFISELTRKDFIKKKCAVSYGALLKFNQRVSIRPNAINDEFDQIVFLE